MPTGKRAKTGKSKEGEKGKSRPKAVAAIKKRPPAAFLAAWVAALFFLAALLYFAHEGRRLPPLSQPPKVAKTPGNAASPPEVRNNQAGSTRENPQTGVRTVPHAPHAANILPAPPHKAAPVRTAQQAPHAANVLPAARPRAAPVPVAHPGHGRPKLAIVIDDLGPNLGVARKFASLPFPVTLSILPFQANSTRIAQMAHSKGREVILHLPMEPLDRRVNPGPGALLVSMSGDQIRLGVTAALDTSPYFDGLNNHMGSRLTQDARAMGIVLSVLKHRKLFFIDSMTINTSVGWKEARRMMVPTCKRDVFLDDNLLAAAIRSQIAKAVEIAKVRGAALAIGHPREITLQTLQAAAPYFRQEGVEMVCAHDLVHR